MNTRIETMLASVLAHDHRAYRQPHDAVADQAFTDDLSRQGLSDLLRAGRRLAHVLGRERPVVGADERIALLRTVPEIPEILTEDEWSRIRSEHRVHELGKVCNICPDYATTISLGLNAPRQQALDGLRGAADVATHDFYAAVVESIDAVLRLADRYAEEAERVGNGEVADMLRYIPRSGARSFQEALQFFRLLHFALWASFNYHNTIGRLDQYLWPYLKADLASGLLTTDDALELVEELFLSFNKDSDLYPGVQQGDNGQSVVLGGMDADGNDAWNPLTDLCLQASLELKLIDPKVNLRVDASSPLEHYVEGTRLTAQGLGFPQYSNDDVVIPGLVELGYSLADARNYVVAACWEFIVPGVGMDIPNIAALSFAGVVDSVVRERLGSCTDFDALMTQVRAAVAVEAEALAVETAGIYLEPAPFLSVLMDGCLARGRDVSAGLRYNNYGIHGTGLSNAADSLAAVKTCVFDDKSVTASELLAAIADDFEGHEALRDTLRFDAPKVGNDDDRVDLIAADLLGTFSAAVADLRNDRGGRFRAGTGSAMYYVTHAQNLGALPDGRKSGEFLSANLAPSIGVKVKGPLSVLRSFTKLPLRGAINGGPVTIEMHDTVFRTAESSAKVAMLVRGFINAGGHQLQINALNSDVLREAQLRPDLHRNLVVRVWGWSAYFVELEKVYQDQIIQRVELVV